MITLKNITKTYGGSAQVQALKGINLTIEDSEIFGIIGKSGAGKSTLVRCINMLEKPTSGQVIIDDKDLTKMSADTKFEFGLNEQGEVVLADEMLTPDSSRFWPLDGYKPGQDRKSVV